MSDAPSKISTAEAGPIDASLRVPVLVLLGFAILHLLGASALGLIAAIKLQNPGFLAGCEFLTYGRVYPAALNELAYGWGVNAGIAVALCLMGRLARGTLPQGGLLIVATIFWNIGLKLGVLGILAGDSTSILWLELPRYVTPFLLVAYTFLAAWVLAVLRRGPARQLYASQWYVLAALFWLPWIWSAAELMLVFAPVRGTVQAVVAAWFAHNLLGLWFTPLALALIYYFIPKVLGRPVRGYYMATFAFWLFAIFTSWAGASRLIGSPVPAWVPTSGQVANFMLLVPLAILSVNFFQTLAGNLGALGHSQVLRFITLSAVVFVLITLRGVVGSLPGFSDITRLTWFTTANDYVVIYGVFSMAVFGAVYFLAPRLMRRAWPHAALISAHFWLATIGLVIGVASLSLGGLQQGQELAAAKVSFSDISTHMRTYLMFATMGGVFLTLGHLAFAINFVRLVLCPRHRSAMASAPVPAALLQVPPELQAPAR